LTLYRRDVDQVVTVPEGEVWCIPDDAFPLLRDYWHTEWEGPLIERFLSEMTPGTMLLDVGAHVGTWTLPFARAGHAVHAWEPSALFCCCLRAGVALNGCDRLVTIHNAALGSRAGGAALRIPALCGGRSSICDNPPVVAHTPPDCGSEAVVVDRLDDVYLGSQAVGLVKIDVEGHEIEVLRGAVRTLEDNHRPPIVYESWPYDWYTSQREALHTLVRSIGYNVERLEGERLPSMFLARRR
jgi:FkbM family methyltransferase